MHGESQADHDVYVMVNASAQPTTFVLQDTTRAWHVAIDTAQPSPDDIELERPRPLDRQSYNVAGHSVVVLST